MELNLQKLQLIINQLSFLKEAPEFSGNKSTFDDVIYELKEVLYAVESKEKTEKWFKENVYDRH